MAPERYNMNVLIYDPTFHTISGSVKYLLPIIDHLSQKHDVTLLGDRLFDERLFLTYYGYILKDTVDIRSLETEGHPPIPMRLTRTLTTLHWCRVISNESAHFDVFINNAAASHSYIEPRTDLSLGILHAPPSLPNYQPRSWHAKLNHKITTTIAKKSSLGPRYKDYRHIVTPSVNIMSLMQQEWNHPSITCCPSWTDFVDPEDDPKAVPKKNVILSVIRLNHEHTHRIDLLINAFTLLLNTGIKEWSLHIVIGSDPLMSERDFMYLSNLKSKIRSLPVYFHINLPYHLLKKLYRQARFFWHCKCISRKDASDTFDQGIRGGTVLDAMRQGAVPLVLAGGAADGFIEHGTSGLLLKAAEDYVSRTLYLITNPAEMSTMSQAAYKRSLLFSKEVFMQHVKELLP